MREDATAKRHRIGAVVLLVMDLILVTTAFLMLGVAVPVFEEVYCDFDVDLPAATQVLFSVSHAIMAFHGVGFALSLGTCLALIVWAATVLYKRGGWSRLSAFVCIVFVCSILAMGVVVAALFPPMLRI